MDVELTSHELAEICNRELNATAGPWTWHSDGTMTSPNKIVLELVSTNHDLDIVPSMALWIGKLDRDFLERSREDVPALINHINVINIERELLRAELAEVTARLADLMPEEAGP